MSREGREIIKVASQFLNMYETKSNAAWEDPGSSESKAKSDLLTLLMRESGWQSGWPYCAAFCEAVWRRAYANLEAPKKVLAMIADRLNPSVVTSYANWKMRTTQNPIPGSIFFMRLSQTWKGHAGIVESSAGAYFRSIEGNTSPEPNTPEADRDGDGIYRRVRRLSFEQNPNGLWLMGFLNPIELPSSETIQVQIAKPKTFGAGALGLAIGSIGAAVALVGWWLIL